MPSVPIIQQPDFSIPGEFCPSFHNQQTTRTIELPEPVNHQNQWTIQTNELVA